MGMLLKCSGSRKSYPTRESNEKRRVAAVWVAERGGALATRAREKRQRLFIGKSKATE